MEIPGVRVFETPFPPENKWIPLFIAAAQRDVKTICSVIFLGNITQQEQWWAKDPKFNSHELCESNF